MPIILPDKKIIHKPLNPRIDWRNPITHGLIFDVPFSEAHGNTALDLVSRTPGAIANGAVWTGTPLGSGLDFSAAASIFSFTTPSIMSKLTAVSVEVMLLIKGAGGGNLARIFQKRAGTDNGYFNAVYDTSVTPAVSFNSQFATSSRTFQTAFTADNQLHQWVFTNTDVTNVASVTAIYLDAVSQAASSSGAGVGAGDVDDTALYIGNRSDGIRNNNAIYAYFRMWNRVLSQPEVSSLRANPWLPYTESLVTRPQRYIQFPPPVVVPPSEREQQTAQIIIDKIVQGEIGGGSTLTMDVPIPSFDAVLVVTGGSVIATGGAWQSVTYNGVALTKLVQASVSGADAEIWWLPYPPVGVYPLVIVPTAAVGQVYANAMVILGVDKKSTNVQSASTTDAASTSTITVPITPDAPNSLIIDALSTLDATAVPLADLSQTQVFNPTSLNAGERILSTFKLSSSSPNNMNYNLSAVVNASLVAISLRPANAPSLWFPNIDTREIDDVVTANGLDAGTTLSGRYGYKPSTFYLNSFFHTVGRNMMVVTPVGKTISYGYKPSTFYLNSFFQTMGRNIKPSNPVASTVKASTFLLMGCG